MPGFDANEILGNLINGMVKMGESVQIIREPIETHGKIIIPAVVANVGLGAGGGGMRSGEGNEEGNGGGGGGGMILTPVFLVVDDKGERLITVPDTISAVSGPVINKIKEMAEGFLAGKEKKEEASKK